MGSNWTFSRILDLQLHINKFTPLNGSSYIKVPTKIQQKEAIINVKNKDEKCFIYVILARFIENEQQDKEKVWMYNKLLQNPDFFNSPIFLNLTRISYPTPFNEIKIVQKNNQCSINLYALDEDVKVYPTESFGKHNS